MLIRDVIAFQFSFPKYFFLLEFSTLSYTFVFFVIFHIREEISSFQFASLWSKSQFTVCALLVKLHKVTYRQYSVMFLFYSLNFYQTCVTFHPVPTKSTPKTCQIQPMMFLFCCLLMACSFRVASSICVFCLRMNGIFGVFLHEMNQIKNCVWRICLSII